MCVCISVACMRVCMCIIEDIINKKVNIQTSFDLMYSAVFKEIFVIVKLHLLNAIFGNQILMMADILMIMIPPIISSRFLVHLKDIIGPSNVLANFPFIFKMD